MSTPMITYSGLGLVLLFLELAYLQIARRYQLFDVPNHRSMHNERNVVRSGGIIFYLAVWVLVALGLFQNYLFVLALTGLVLVSFWDDVTPVQKRYRLGMQLVVVAVLLQTPTAFGAQPSYWVWVVTLCLCIGVLNAYNFMDGINGMTALYSMVTLGSLWYMNWRGVDPETEYLLIIELMALLVFAYFNVRKQAVCFAGDVGSLTMGFVILKLLLDTVMQLRTGLPLLCLAVYGVDSGLTLLRRIVAGQDVFQGHRMHLFQRLVYKAGWPQLRVSILYALIQLGVNALVIPAMAWPSLGQLGLAIAVLSVLSAGYVWKQSVLSD